MAIVESSKHFARGELACRHCGRCEMDEGFMLVLEELRVKWGRPIALTSAYRCPEHNSRVSTTGLDGPHTTGKAVDILISGEDAFELVVLALEIGFLGVGVKQKGGGRFIHLDICGGPRFPRPRIWSY